MSASDKDMWSGEDQSCKKTPTEVPSLAFVGTGFCFNAEGRTLALRKLLAEFMGHEFKIDDLSVGVVQTERLSDSKDVIANERSRQILSSLDDMSQHCWRRLSGFDCVLLLVTTRSARLQSKMIENLFCNSGFELPMALTQQRKLVQR